MTHRKIFICIAGLLAAAGLLSGCYNEAMGDTKKEETVLKWICGGVGEQRDSEKVWKNFKNIFPIPKWSLSAFPLKTTAKNGN